MSEQYQIAGKIIVIDETQTFPSGFMKREFVVTTAHDKYSQDIKFEVSKDKCSTLDSLKVGQDVQVHFNIRGNEHNGRYYINLQAWKIDAESRDPNQNGARPPEGARSPEYGKKEQPRDNGGAQPDDEDIPFARFEPPF